MRRTRILLVSGSAAAGLLLTSSAWAGASLARTSAVAPTSVVLGQTTGTPIGCGSAFAGVQSATGGNPSYTTPTAGVITSFSTQASPGGGQVRLLMFVATSPTTYQVVGKSALMTVTASTLNTFPTRVSVPAGALLGSQMTPGSMQCAVSTGVAADTIRYGAFNPDASDTFTPTSSAGTLRWDISAVLESDADRDGYGDVTQDLCPESALAQTLCPAPDTKVTKKPKKTSTQRKVTFKSTSTIAGSTFTCQVDKKAAKPCKAKFKKNFKYGKHKVVVTAISPAGIPDPTPVTVKFRIVKGR